MSEVVVNGLLMDSRWVWTATLTWFRPEGSTWMSHDGTRALTWEEPSTFSSQPTLSTSSAHQMSWKNPRTLSPDTSKPHINFLFIFRSFIFLSKFELFTFPGRGITFLAQLRMTFGELRMFTIQHFIPTLERKCS